MKLLFMVLVLVFNFAGMASAEERKCHTKTEVGESISGTSKIYETTKNLNPSVFSIMDFEKLTIKNADDGSKSYLIKISENVYTLSTGQYKWFFITNEDETIVTETSLSKNIGYLKIFFCE